LRQEIYDQIEYIFSLPNAVPDQTENVYLTLATRPDLQALALDLILFGLDPARADWEGQLVTPFSTAQTIKIKERRGQPG
jgi:hypothetical protein